MIDSDEANKSISKTEEKAEGLGTKLGEAIKTAAKWGMALGAAAGALAIKLGKEVISAFSGYEQLVGGIDTLFKESSGKMQEYAENAYKTAGLSANDYMETVTGFSASLISSLGGNTEKAVEYANMAITDMSDNANKMGTDISSIQNAYSGFAKQNYTMLDNLKLGYGGTKEEMARLLEDATAISGIDYDVSSYADVVDAIHVIQTEMGITGTTALEAEATIGGSINAMKASWGNWLVGLGNSEADMQGLTSNLVDGFLTVMDNITPIISNIVEALPLAFTGMLPVITEILPDMLDVVMDLFQQVLNALIQLLPELIPIAVNAITTIVDTLINNLPLLIDAAITLIMALTGGLVDALPELIPAVIAMIILLTTELIKRIPEILEFVPELFTNLVQAFKEIDWASLGSDLMKGIVNGIVDLKDWVVEKVKEVAGNIAQGFKDFFGIASPSKLMAEYGKNMDEGLAEGITANEVIPLNAITSVGEKLASAARTAAKTVMDLLTIDASGITITGSTGEKVAVSGGNTSANKRKASDLEKYKDEIYAIADKYGADISTGYEMWKTNERDKIFGREETYKSSSKSSGIIQNITVNSPKALSPSEVAKETAKATTKLALSLLR